MSWKLRVFPIFRSNYENNLDRNFNPRERPKFSRHYEACRSHNCVESKSEKKIVLGVSVISVQVWVKAFGSSRFFAINPRLRKITWLFWIFENYRHTQNSILHLYDTINRFWIKYFLSSSKQVKTFPFSLTFWNRHLS